MTEPAKKSNAILFVLLGGGAFLLLLFAGCAGAGWYAFFFLPKRSIELVDNTGKRDVAVADEGLPATTKELNPVADVPIVPKQTYPASTERQPPKPAGDSVTLDQALADLRPGRVDRRRKALDWLARAKVDSKRQAEVAKKIEDLLEDEQVRDQAAGALAVWATKENVPALIRAVESDSEPVRHTAMRTLGKLKDERGAAPVAKRLTKLTDRPVAVKALLAMGPVAEPEVVKYAFDPDRGIQTEARKILTTYDTKTSVLLSQAVVDLKTGDNGHRQQVAERLEKMSLEKTPVDEAQQSDVAKALAPLLLDNDQSTRDRVLRALQIWATKDIVPALLKQLDNRDSKVRKQIAEILAKLKDERAIVPIALRLNNFYDQEFISNALITMGPMVEPEVLKGLSNKDHEVRRQVCRVLGAVGTKKSLAPLQALLAVEQDTNVAINAANAIKAIEGRKGK